MSTGEDAGFLTFFGFNTLCSFITAFYTVYKVIEKIKIYIRDKALEMKEELLDEKLDQEIETKLQKISNDVDNICKVLEQLVEISQLTVKSLDSS